MPTRRRVKLGPLRGVELERLGQQSQGVAARSTPCAALQLADRVRTDIRPRGELLLSQRRMQTIVSQQVAKAPRPLQGHVVLPTPTCATPDALPTCFIR